MDDILEYQHRRNPVAAKEEKPKSAQVTADGNALLHEAVLVSCRGTSRDGGMAVRALTDWLEEQLGINPWVAVADTRLSGFILVVSRSQDPKNSMPYDVVLLDMEKGEQRWGNFRNMGVNEEEDHADFPDWFPETIMELWN
jgi:hypothetical protein